MNAWLVCSAAVLLSLERITYVLVWRDPIAFRNWSGRAGVSALGDPVEMLAFLFGAFKLLQIAVFIAWHLALGDGTLLPHSHDPIVLGAGAALIAAGQALNLSVFRRLGKVGVFYGNKFGHDVSWCRSFPFTWFDHPQYVGTVMAIWGFFFLMRFPAPDWIVLPILESVYYAAGARLERDPERRSSTKRRCTSS